MCSMEIRSRVAVCPACGDATLFGHAADLPEAEVEYDGHFLPRPRNRDDRALAGRIVDDLTPYDNYLCPGDLYAYTGNLANGGAAAKLDDNVFAEFARFLRGRRPEFLGARVRFFLAALFANGLPRAALEWKDGPAREREAVAGAVAALVGTAAREAEPNAAVHKAFRRLLDEHGWNPLASLPPDLHVSAPVLRAFFELQLGDVLYLLRRSIERKPAPVAYPRLYDALARAGNLMAQEKPLDADLVADLLFQCLRMAGLFPDGRAGALGLAARAASRYLARIFLRVGANLSAGLDRLARNPDVILFLYMNLAREHGDPVPDESSLLRFLQRRSRMVPDYSIPRRTAESLRAARIGRELAQRRDEFTVRHGIADADAR